MHLFLLVLVNYACGIFLYEHWKGLGWLKNNVDKIYYFEWISQNSPRGRNPFLRTMVIESCLSSIICLGFLKISIKIIVLSSSIISSNVSKLLESKVS